MIVSMTALILYGDSTEVLLQCMCILKCFFCMIYLSSGKKQNILTMKAKQNKLVDGYFMRRAVLFSERLRE